MPKNNSQEITQNNTEYDTETIPKHTPLTPEQRAETAIMRETNPGIHPNRYPIWTTPGESQGAPTKCTLELTSYICDILKTGGYIETACSQAGIPDRRYYAWMQQAERDETAGKYPGFTGSPDESPFMAFRQAVKIARDTAENEILKKIYDGETDRNWMRYAWILERTRQERFGQRQQIDVTHTVSGPAYPTATPKSHEEWLILRDAERKALQSQASDAEYKDAAVETGTNISRT